jgi:hypothetical protein
MLFWVVTSSDLQVPTSVSEKHAISIFKAVLASTYKSTRRHNPQQQYRYLHRRGKLNFHILHLLCFFYIVRDDVQFLSSLGLITFWRRISRMGIHKEAEERYSSVGEPPRKIESEFRCTNTKLLPNLVNLACRIYYQL